MLDNITSSATIKDKVKWLKDKEKGYSIKSSYVVLDGLRIVPLLQDSIRQSLVACWNSYVPKKLKHLAGDV